MAVRAIRGATTVEFDDATLVSAATQELLQAILAGNDLTVDDVISVLFTVTPDIVSIFPAAAARDVGFGSIPLMCAQEIPVVGSKALCIRTLMHVESDRSRDEIRHIYLRDAQSLRDDLPK